MNKKKCRKRTKTFSMDVFAWNKKEETKKINGNY
jgi:hypothetical protein